MLGSLGRVHDITVIGRPGGRGSRMTALEAALFDSGRPVLMAPPAPPSSFGETVLIHWNASTETARCMLFAMPLLKQARSVSFIAVEGAIERLDRFEVAACPDLLVKGAYTQSRLRQMIFGGATSQILAAAELPVFFAH